MGFELKNLINSLSNRNKNIESFEGSLLRKSMGTYGVVAGYRSDEKKYMLIPARASKEIIIVGGTECKIADAGFPNNATTKVIYESLGVP